MNRWCVFVDIEGFSNLYGADFESALVPLRALMKGIYRVGVDVCPETPNRLFAHHIGDGFVIVSEFAERSPELPIAFGIFLLRNVLIAGGMAKCAVSTGDFADIKDCYPDEIHEKIDSSGTLRLGGGMMRVFPVMGTALINAYRLSGKEKGSVLIIDRSLSDSLPEGLEVTRSATGYQVVDWIHARTPELDEILHKTGVTQPSTVYLAGFANAYVERYRSSLPPKWIENTLKLNRLCSKEHGKRHSISMFVHQWIRRFLG